MSCNKPLCGDIYLAQCAGVQVNKHVRLGDQPIGLKRFVDEKRKPLKCIGALRHSPWHLT